MYLQNRGDEEEFFFSFPSQKFSLSHYFTPKRAFFHYFNRKISVTNGHHTTTAIIIFFFYEQSIHSLLFTTATFFCLQGGLKRFGNCVPLLHPKRPTRKIFPLFPMVLFLFSPRELIKRPSLGRLNKYLGQTLTNHQQVK